MHIDEDLLNRVIQKYRFSSKTEAVDKALAEMDRRSAFSGMVKKGMNMSSTDLEKSVYPEYDVHALRAAETRPSYGKRNAKRRRS